MQTNLIHNFARRFRHRNRQFKQMIDGSRKFPLNNVNQ